ncbi:class I SAM-dependent methyltransferase [Virgibacillus necropolis]|nr:class I SAM-dependent methyltransferase [Virgibacillus necropolis]
MYEKFTGVAEDDLHYKKRVDGIDRLTNLPIKNGKIRDAR